MSLINFFRLENVRKSFTKNDIPLMESLITRLQMEQPFLNKHIVYNGHLTPFSVLQIEALLRGGAKLTVIIDNGLVCTEDTVEELRKSNISLVSLSDIKNLSCDLALDCCGKLLGRIQPKYGVAELTRTGVKIYESTATNFPVISVDDSYLKQIETLLGTADGFVRAFRIITKTGLAYKKFIVFGYGKVGKGIVSALSKFNSTVVIVEVDPSKQKEALSDGFSCYLATDKEELKKQFLSACAVITATGNKHTISQYFTLDDFPLIHLINMGAEDEWGENFPHEKILNDKIALNFYLDEPTRAVFLDPVFAAQVMALEYFLMNKMTSSVHNLPSQLDLDLLTQWTLKHHHINLDGDYLQGIIKTIPCYIYWKDQDSVYRGCNELFAKAAGFDSPTDVVGKTDYELGWLPTEADIYRKGDAEVFSGHELLNIEETQHQADGQEKVVFASKVPYRDDQGHIIGVLGVYTDITKIKEQEKALVIAKKKAEEANEIKSEFLAIASHELRTPLTAILGMLDILHSDKLFQHEFKQYLSDIETESEYLLSLVNNILDSTKLEAGQYGYKENEFNLNDLLRQLKQLFKPQVENKNIELSIKLCDEGLVPLIGDVQILKQILINIIANAIKFTEQGTVELEIEHSSRSVEKEELIFIVRDTGIGIPADKLDTVFERFTQIDGSISRKYAGAGLGLSIVKKLITILNGTINVKSQEGKGTTFTSIISFKKAHMKNNDISSNAFQQSFKDHKLIKPIKVLLVEDEPIVQMVHRQFLINIGCDVIVAKNAIEALSQWKEADFIFMDIGLPEMSGFDVVKKIRAEEKNIGVKIPIVMLTAFSDSDKRNTALEIGSNNLIVKPAKESEMKGIIQQYAPQFFDGYEPNEEG